MKRAFAVIVWIAVAALGSAALGSIALHRGEPLNATWFVVAAVCCYLVAYRLYSAFVAAKVLALDEVSERGGFIAQLAVLAIMTILLAVIGLVVVNALKSSPWATFTLAMTIPIALLLGLSLRFVRPGRVLEASIMGVALVLLVVVAGQWVADSPSWSRVFTLGGVALAFAIIAYGFAASALPVWLLLAPRDYLSAFIKAGAIFSLAAGILFVRPQVLMPPLTRFIDV